MPNLAIVAGCLFSVPISSASVERLFSFAGQVVTARRNRLSADVFDKIVCVAYNDPVLQAARAELLAKRNK